MRMIAPNTMRYHANAANECLLTNRSSSLVTSSALMKDATQLTMSGSTSALANSARAFQMS